jgi:hypothetical protein
VSQVAHCLGLIAQASFIADQPRDGDPNNGKADDVTEARVNSTPAG